MTLTTSDWVAITAAIGQVAATVLSVVWQVKKTVPATGPEVNPASSNVYGIRFFRKYAASLLSIALGLVGLSSLFWWFPAVNKAFIAGCIFFSFLCLFHLLAILFFEFMYGYSDVIVDQIFTAIGYNDQPKSPRRMR